MYYSENKSETILYKWTAMPFVTLIGWNCTVRCFPTKTWQAAYFLQKTNNYFKIFVVIKRKRTHVFVSQVWGCHYPPFTVGNTSCHPATILRFTKHVSLTFRSFVMANLRNSVTFHEKSGRSGENTFWMLPAIPDVTLISWNDSVRYLFPGWSRKQHVSFRKLKNMTRVVVIKRKLKQWVFLSGLRLYRWKILLLP